jgi:hypothetical protein
MPTSTSRVLVFALLGSLIGSAVLLGAEVSDPAFRQAVGERWVEWRPLVEHEGLTLRIAGADGAVREFGFEAGASAFVLIDSPAAWPDEVYVYELLLTPRIDDELRAALAEARARGDEETIARLRTLLPGPLVESGAFRVEGGVVVPAGLPEVVVGSRDDAGDGARDVGAPGLEPVTGRDQQIGDDLIVSASVCAGADCVNGEDFGDDTLRLKQPVVRLDLVDTSSMAGFPANDWRIVVNDAGSGGADRLSIDDATHGTTPFTLLAGAPTNSLFVAASGNVGLRTATPATELHLATGNTPEIRLEQNASGGMTPQSWDLAGNETGFFVRDVTNGSKVPLRIAPNAPTSSFEVVADGSVGFGTASPLAPVHIIRDGATVNASFVVENTGGSFPGRWYFQNQSANGAFVITSTGALAPLKVFPGAPENSLVVGQNGGGSSPRVGIHRVSSIGHPLQVGTDATNGNGAHVTAAGVWTNGSSRAHKEGIVALEGAEALATLAALEPVRYRGREDASGEEYLGFIAEDVPELVAMNDRRGLSPMDLVAVLTRAMQEQQRRLEHQEAEIRAMAEALAALTPSGGAVPAGRPAAAAGACAPGGSGPAGSPGSPPAER